MNAYELADELAKYDWYYEETFVGEDGYTQERQVCWTSLTEESAAMLRQQADRIAELERFIEDRGETCAFIVWSNTRGEE